MPTRLATTMDVDTVEQDMSFLSRREILIAGTSRLEANLMMRQGAKHHDAIVGEYNGNIGFFFWMEYEDNRFITSFISTKYFFESPVAFTNMARKRIKQYAEEHPGEKILSYTASKHKKADRWFNLLGFSLVMSQKSVKVFEFAID